jgi:general secretion pathway protein D
VGDLDVLVKAIAEQGSVRMIAAPQVVAMNNEPAVMRAGTNEVYFSRAKTRGNADDVEGRAMSVAQGLTLTVTPHIGADGIVQLNVAPTWAEKTGQVKSPAGDMVPVLRVSEADTLVRVQEGEAVVISGLLQERTEARMSSGFSGFFGAQQRRTVRVELVVLLSPALVLPGVIGTEGLR